MPSASTYGKGTVVRFEGPTDGVEGFVPVDPARRREIRVRVATTEGYQDARALTAPAGNHTLVRLVLPPDLPAGSADAVVEVGDDVFAATIDIIGRAELQCSTARLDLVVSGKETGAVLQVVNVGNVPVEIPDIAAFGLMSEGGLDSAIGIGLTSATRSGVDRLGGVADALADRHGGLVRVVLRSDDAPLAPGQATQVAAVFRPGPNAKPEQQYFGVLRILNLKIGVRLRIEGTPPVIGRPRAKGAAKNKGGSS